MAILGDIGRSNLGEFVQGLKSERIQAQNQKIQQQQFQSQEALRGEQLKALQLSNQATEAKAARENRFISFDSQEWINKFPSPEVAEFSKQTAIQAGVATEDGFTAGVYNQWLANRGADKQYVQGIADAGVRGSTRRVAELNDEISKIKDKKNNGHTLSDNENTRLESLIKLQDDARIRLANDKNMLTQVNPMFAKAEERERIRTDKKQFLINQGAPAAEVEKMTDQGLDFAIKAKQDEAAARAAGAKKEAELTAKAKVEDEIGSIDPDAFKNETTLRKEFTQLAGDFRTIRDSHRRVLAASKLKTGAGDLALIFNYMKILDPKSVVRESEFRQAEISGNIPERVRQAFGKALKGEKLSTQMRNEFLASAKSLFSTSDKQHNQRVSEFTKLATRNKLNPKNVVIKFTSAPGNDDLTKVFDVPLGASGEITLPPDIDPNNITPEQARTLLQQRRS
jgi:hypothetical protein